MNWNWHLGKSATLPNPAIRPDRKKLRALIDQATSDSVDESDEHCGLLSMIREEVACPFLARVQGEEIECLRFEWPKNGYGLNAVCKGKEKTRVVDISLLEWVEPRPGATNGSKPTSLGAISSADYIASGHCRAICSVGATHREQTLCGGLHPLYNDAIAAAEVYFIRAGCQRAR